MLGLKYPIFQSPMAGISTIKLASAITNSGGLGAIPLAAVDLRNPDAIESIRGQLDSFRSHLDNPELSRNVNLNFFCHDRSIQASSPTAKQIANWKTVFTPAFNNHDLSKIEFPISNVSFQELEESGPQKNYNSLLELLAEYRPKVVSFHFGVPSQKTIDSLQSNGIDVFVSVTSLAEAKFAASKGVRGLTCQGFEAGGHRGNFLESTSNDENLSTYVLTNLVAREFGKQLYVVPAGGIMNGRDIDNYLSLPGVSAVQVGTVFLDTKESLSNGYISKHRELPTTMISSISGKTARCLRTPFIESVIKNNKDDLDLPPYGYTYSAFKSAVKAAGNPDNGFFLAGQGFPVLKGNGAGAAEVFQELVDEMKGKL
ncbi:putative nitronate monooxygenase [[Candida] railenensis]|uniref:Nitronate monooxygenase n=1 Tax=[Candida] railenensis TaxID=45579 RepID=A0A9P0VZ53_9ASCO|nr:putative nitronate monooxygenase [[Candida] railenensis]